MSIPPQAYAAALAGFDEMTVHRLLALFRRYSPEQAFAVATGEVARPTDGLIAQVLADASVRQKWLDCGHTRRPQQVWQRCLDLEVGVNVIGQADYPALLQFDPLPPPVLFTRGEMSLLHLRRVAIVGTRNATGAGRHMARQLGFGLADAGVQVVSGLARGIDGQAHRGVLEAIDGRGALGRPVAVVASGPDVVYPREHVAMWQRVCETGLLISESPPGHPPAAYRFPLRNRIIAALSEVVVVVESRERGGSLITANQAAERGVPVMAVPGQATNRAAAGANALLRDGSPPALDVGDVLMALDLDHSHCHGSLIDHRRRPHPNDLGVYRICEQGPRTVGDAAALLGRSLVDMAMALARLEQLGWLTQTDGWFETVGSPLR